MAKNKNTSIQSSMAEPSFEAIRVMVVDDDIICLSIVAGMLRSWKYQVVTVKNAEDALVTLRSRNNFFNLVITDVHMPVMDGFEFQMQVREEFRLPVVMMSADDRESSMLRGLEGGAVFYIVKPVSYDDLKDLWQYAVSPRKGKSSAISEIESAQRATPIQKPLKIGADFVAMVQEEKQIKRESKKKAEAKVIEGNEQEKCEAAVPRKSKVVWTTELHNEFLEAIKKIGLDRAVPKRILEHMKEPAGLTRENVASHLQKYRIFLKRITEAASSDGSSHGKNLIERTLRSSFASGHPSLVINALQQGLLGNIQLLPSFSSSIFSNPQASSSNPRPELGYGQSRLGENSGYLQLPTFGNNSFYQTNGGHINGTNLKKMYEQETQARPELVPDVIHDIQNKGSSSGSGRTPDLTGNYSIADQVGFSGNGVSSGLNGNMNSGYYSQGGYCPTGLGRTNQQNNLGNGGLFDQLINNIIPQESVFAPQFADSDAYNTFLNHQKNSSYIEGQAREDVRNHGQAINSYHVEQNPLENQQYSNQIESNGGMRGYNTNQLDDYCPSFDEASQQQGGGGLMDPGSYDGYPIVNPSWNQGINDDISDSVFGPGRY